MIYRPASTSRWLALFVALNPRHEKSFSYCEKSTRLLIGKYIEEYIYIYVYLKFIDTTIYPLKKNNVYLQYITLFWNIDRVLVSGIYFQVHEYIYILKILIGEWNIFSSSRIRIYDTRKYRLSGIYFQVHEYESTIRLIRKYGSNIYIRIYYWV